MHNLVKEATDIDFTKFEDLTTAKEVALQMLNAGGDNQNKSSIEACPSVGHVLNEVNHNHLLVGKINIINSYNSYEKGSILNRTQTLSALQVFELVVEPKLLQPTFVLDYPLEVSPLAKPHRRCLGLRGPNIFYSI